jgi:uncharacterized protein
VRFHLGKIDWKQLSGDKDLKVRLGCAVLIVLTAAFLFDMAFSIKGFKSYKETPAKVVQPAPVKKEPAKVPQKTPAKQHVKFIQKFFGRKAKVSIILDDAGGSAINYDRIFSIKYRLTLSIIPNLPKSYIIAKEASARGMEVMLHLPMEANDPAFTYRDGGMVICADDDDKIKKIVKDDFENIKIAKGFNNHMGSKATANERVMRAVFAAMDRTKFFVNSRTNTSPVASSLARQLGIRTADNTEFLDGSTSKTEIESRLSELVARARRYGMAIGIGHATRPMTIEVLKEMMPYYAKNGVTFIYASEAVR